LKSKGSFTVVEEIMPAGTTEIRHFHKNVEQFFYCLEGTLHMEHEGNMYVLFFEEGITINQV